ncbi:MAG: hypothetical protein II453_19195 [Alphaproteobacteria bacterium]|nr:hypothetical protein [Alphaproteobacteria bacterium]MBQ4009382.1 hypothetical protein [Bacteroidales bacterium]
MEAKELTIGCFVRHKKTKKIFKVNMITPTCISVEGSDKPLLRISDFEPVNLTAKILENSYFEKQELGGENVIMWTGYGNENAGDIEVEFTNGDIFLKIDVSGCYFTKSYIKYVHELQLAFTNCEINKEIKIL